jgi:D-amino-acid dehydrogenase
MKATVIGGGIIGLSAALYLREAGCDVVVLERDNHENGCSYGNMGYLSPSHFAPLAQPGIISQGILWMFDKKSPFYVRPEWNTRLFDWGLKFVRACNAGHVQRNIKPMVELLLLSRHLTQEWQQKGMSFEFASKGCINYFQTEKYEKAELENVRMGRDLGLQIDLVSREQAQELEPELRPEVRGGAWYRDDAHLHPNALMQVLRRYLVAQGVEIRTNTEVTGFEKQQGRITAINCRGAAQPEVIHPGDVVVLAAGSWSGELARQTAEYLPMMPGKGYSMTVDVPRQTLNHPCILLEAKVAITPWERQLRIGSTMEIGAVNGRILPLRVQGILDAVPRFLPGYKTDPVFQELAQSALLPDQIREKVWYGFRPLSADGVPYIGFAKRTDNLMIATGHAMLGLSQAAATGKLVAEMILGEQTSIGVGAFDPGRV